MSVKELTLSQRIDRAEAAIACEKVIAGHCFGHAAGLHREEFFGLWSRRGDITWAHAFGQLGTSFDVYQLYVLNQEQNAWQRFKELWVDFPEVRDRITESGRMLDHRAFLETAVHLLTTPVIEVAEDGKSCQGLWYTPGVVFNNLLPGKERRCTWMYERLCCDFVKEDGGWRFLNLRVCPDAVAEADNGYWFNGPPVSETPAEEDTAPAEPPSDGPVMKIPGPIFLEISMTQIPQNPGIPEPHRTCGDIRLYSDVAPITI